MYKLLYPSITVRTAPPVSVRVRVVLVLVCTYCSHVRIFAIADLNRCTVLLDGSYSGALQIAYCIVLFVFGVIQACELPLFEYVADKMSALCYERAWYTKLGGYEF